MTDKAVAFAVPGDLTTLTGGYIFDRRVMRELQDTGWNVTHLALSDGFPTPSPRDMSESLQSISSLPHDLPVVIDGLAFGAFDPEATKQIKNPIVALVHHPLAREHGLSNAQQALLYESERANLRFATHVIVPSPHTAEMLITDYGVAADAITIARPGIDQPTAKSTPTDPPLILSVGIQLPRKGHDILLQALAQIADLDWQAVIAGKALDRDYASQLQSMLSTLGLEGRVVLAGQMAQAALGRLYQQATVFALATRYEGYGIVFDEALVHGLPIVSCRAGAVPDTVPERAGLLVPTDDPEALANALRQMITDKPFRDGAAGVARKVGLTRPGWAATAARFAEALQGIKQAAP